MLFRSVIAQLQYFGRGQREYMDRILGKYRSGESGVVKQVSGVGAVRRRLLDMGVTPGARIIMRKVAPLGDPMEVTLRGYELTLRKAEADCVIMKEDDNA